MLLAFQIHGHHPPGQILHALLVGQLGLGPAVELPYLGAQRIFLLHLVGMDEVGAGGIVAPVGKDRLAEDIPRGLAVLE